MSNAISDTVVQAARNQFQQKKSSKGTNNGNDNGNGDGNGNDNGDGNVSTKGNNKVQSSSIALDSATKSPSGTKNTQSSEVSTNPANRSFPANPAVPPINSLLAKGYTTAAAKNRMVASSLSFLQTGSAPILSGSGSAVGALNSQKALNALSENQPYDAISVNQTYGANALAMQSDVLSGISSALGNLDEQTANLQNALSSNQAEASSSNSSVATAVGGGGVSAGPVSISVMQLASGQVVSSSIPTQTSTATTRTTTSNTMATPSGVAAEASQNGGNLAKGTYYFRVSALDASGHESAASSEISAGISANSGEGGVSLSWSAVANAASYRVYTGTQAGNETSYGTSNSASFNYTGDGEFNSGSPLNTAVSWNTTSTVTTQSTVNLASNVSLGYTGVFSVNGFNVNVNSADSLLSISGKINGGATSPTSLTATADKTTGGNLSAGTYNYRVSAVDGGGNESAAGDVASATVGGSNNSVSLSWGDVPNAVGYKVYYGTSASNMGSYYLSNGKNATFTDLGNTNSSVSGNPTLFGTDNGASSFLDKNVGVSAGISNGQLLLKSTNGQNIMLDDKSGGVLQGIGVLSANPYHGTTAINTANDQYQDARRAVFSVNGQTYTSATNSGIDAGGVSLSLTGTGNATIQTSPKPSAQVLRAVESFASSYNNAVSSLNGIILNGGASAKSQVTQQIYSDMVKNLFAALPTPQGGIGSVSDVGFQSSGSRPTGISDVTLGQLAAKNSRRNNGSLSGGGQMVAGNGPLSLSRLAGTSGVNSVDNNTVGLDSAALENALQQNPAGVTDMLNYASSRLQNRIGLYLQPGFGVLALQRQVVGYYANNQGQVDSIKSGAENITVNQINHGNTVTLLQSISA
ncbi:MAG: hypothetical protein HY280_03825 [Nitrospinae bacterium]|nr:hypothetical protein [Nitrospinota bacterium]